MLSTCTKPRLTAMTSIYSKLILRIKLLINHVNLRLDKAKQIAMKYFICIVVLSLLSAGLFAQQSSLSDVVNFKIPQGAARVKKDQMQTLAKANGAYPKRLASSKISKGEFFTVNNFALHVNASKGDVSADFLLKHKVGSDDLAQMETGSPPQGYTSDIKKINGNTVLITHNVRPNGNYYIYHVVNPTNNRTLIGSIDYDRNDKKAKAQAEKMMYEILNSIVFK